MRGRISVNGIVRINKYMTLASPSDEIARFEDARGHIRAFCIAKAEVLWRAQHKLNRSNSFRKAIERLLYGCPLEHFRSRADDCACRYASLRANDDFPGYVSPIDVFYGDAQAVDTRIDDWSAKWFQNRKTERKNNAQNVTLLDVSLVDALGKHGRAFMATVRELPCFRESWNGKQHNTGMFVHEGLDKCEKQFHRLFGSVSAHLAKQPVCPNDVYDLSLCLGTKLPSSIATDELCP